MVDMLDELARITYETLAKDLYCFKGGWVLNKLFGDKFRVTSDVDISVLNEKCFTELEVAYKNYCDELVRFGKIQKYKIIKPDLLKNRSGGVKLYVYSLQYKKTVKYTGVDISIKDLSYGITVMANGLPVFSYERMLADKLSVVYSSNILRRIRDLYDIYLICSFVDIDIHKLKYCCEKRNVDFNSNVNIFTLMDEDTIIDAWSKFYSQEQRSLVYVELKTCIETVYRLRGLLQCP